MKIGFRKCWKNEGRGEETGEADAGICSGHPERAEMRKRRNEDRRTWTIQDETHSREGQRVQNGGRFQEASPPGPSN